MRNVTFSRDDDFIKLMYKVCRDGVEIGSIAIVSSSKSYSWIADAQLRRHIPNNFEVTYPTLLGTKGAIEQIRKALQ